MEITEVKVRLVADKTERLRAFCTVTLDREFVVRDIKIIDGARGLFVAMPSRKLTDHCPKCGNKNHLRAKFCNDCGARLPGERLPDPAEASGKLHVDVAHPINSECHGRFQKAILTAYEEELGEGGSSVPEPSASVSDTQESPELPTETVGDGGERAPGQEDDKPFGAGIF